MLTQETYDTYTQATLNAYWSFKMGCNFADLPISDRKLFCNQDFMKQLIKARKECRILITEIEKAYKAAGIDLSEIEKENEVIYNIMEVLEEKTDKIDIKPRVKIKF